MNKVSADVSPPSSINYKFANWTILAIVLLPWLVMRALQPTHPDILWLCMAMERLLDGLTMSGSAYETNPPLSLLVYIIPAALHKYFDLPVAWTTLAQSTLIFAGCTFMFSRVLKCFPSLSERHRLALLLGYILAATIGSQKAFGERDQWIGMVLPPFVLIQAAITYGIYTQRRFTWPFMMLGSLLIWLKPHHGLIPFLMILHRIYKQRSVAFLKDPDFISLATMTCLYLPLTWLFFRDYVEIIMPDVIVYYFQHVFIVDLVFNAIFALLFSFAIFAGTWEFLKKSAVFHMIMFFTLCGTLSVIPVLVQAKGFYYHYCPMIMFLAPGGMLFLYEMAQRYSSTRRFALPLATLIVAAIGYTGAPLKFEFPRYEELTAIVSEANQTSDNKSFWIYDDVMDLPQQLNEATGIPYASRFASTWFLNAMYGDMRRERDGKLPPEKSAKLHKDFLRFSSMMAEDLKINKPNVVIMLSPDFFFKNYDEKFDMIAFLSQNPEFKEAWQPYVFSRQVTYEQVIYFSNLDYVDPTKIFDVYLRQPPN